MISKMVYAELYWKKYHLDKTKGQKNYPLGDYTEFGPDKECLCKNCIGMTYGHFHCYVYNWCRHCRTRIWYICARYLLYSRGPMLICFDCRRSFHKQRFTSDP